VAAARTRRRTRPRPPHGPRGVGDARDQTAARGLGRPPRRPRSSRRCLEVALRRAVVRRVPASPRRIGAASGGRGCRRHRRVVDGTRGPHARVGAAVRRGSGTTASRSPSLQRRRGRPGHGRHQWGRRRPSRRPSCHQAPSCHRASSCPRFSGARPGRPRRVCHSEPVRGRRAGILRLSPIASPTRSVGPPAAAAGAALRARAWRRRDRRSAGSPRSSCGRLARDRPSCSRSRSASPLPHGIAPPIAVLGARDRGVARPRRPRGASRSPGPRVPSSSARYKRHRADRLARHRDDGGRHRRALLDAAPGRSCGACRR
jgi:hypothetical protein